MAKKGLEISTVQAVLKDVQNNLGWSLCIGAGTSAPILPDWFALVDKLMNLVYIRIHLSVLKLTNIL